MLEKLRQKNEGLPLFDLDDPRAKEYGRRVKGIDFTAMIADANRMEIPDGVRYQASNEILERDPDKLREVESTVYGEMPIQAGICWGKSTKLNGLEWHKGSEVVVAATDLVLLLALYREIEWKNGQMQIDTKHVVGVYLKAGDAMEVYSMVMHLAPCQVSDDGFRAIIILPRGTNEKLERPTHDPLLLAKNKWMVGHADANARVTAVVGVNTELKY